MSEQPTATAAKPAAPKGAAGKKYAGLTKQQWYIAGGVFVAALIYIVWRNKKNAAAASQGQAAANQGSNECTDANGNPVDCNQAFAQELADLANAMDQLQAQGGGAGGSGVTGTVGTVPATTPTTTTGAPATTQPAGTPTTSSGGTATKAPPAAKPGPPPTPGNVHATAVTKSSITVAWNKVTGATSYRIRVTYQSKLVSQQSSASTTATISGLGADHTYGIHVASVGPGGTGPEGNVDIKTAKL